MSWPDPDQSRNRDWAAAVIAAADEPLDQSGARGEQLEPSDEDDGVADAEQSTGDETANPQVSSEQAPEPAADEPTFGNATVYDFPADPEPPLMPPALPALQAVVSGLVAAVQDLSADIRTLRGDGAESAASSDRENLDLASVATKVEAQTQAVQDLLADIRTLRSDGAESAASSDRKNLDLASELATTRAEVASVATKVEAHIRVGFVDLERRIQELLAQPRANIASPGDIQGVLEAVNELRRILAG